MKRRNILPACALICLLLYGCNKSDTESGKKAVEIELSGAIGAPTRAAIDPPSGSSGLYHIPPYQLSIGVAMVNYGISTPVSAGDYPDAQDWNGALWKRAYFGGVGLGASPVTNGEIKFTNDAGTAVNKIFYDDGGIYSFLKAVYPYEGASVTSTGDGGSILFQGIDGSQDIMSANIVWGNKDNQVVNDILTFKHLLTRLNILMYAENTNAIDQYGKILEVGIAYQPEKIIMNIDSEELQPASSITRYDVYNTVGFDPAADREFPDNAADPEAKFGYVMAIPAAKYTIVVETEKRLHFYTDVALSGISSFEAGKVYNVTLKFLAADEIIIEVSEPDEWWMDSTFN